MGNKGIIKVGKASRTKLMRVSLLRKESLSVVGHQDGVAGFLLTGGGSATKKKQRKGERKRAGRFRTWSPVVVGETPLWTPGPTAKPVLCNACGSRWGTKGTLDDYLPKHASKGKQSYQLPSEMKTHLIAHDDQKMEVGEEVSGQDGSSACLEEEMINISSLGSAGSSSDKFMQMEETNVQARDPEKQIPDLLSKLQCKNSILSVEIVSILNPPIFPRNSATLSTSQSFTSLLKDKSHPCSGPTGNYISIRIHTNLEEIPKRELFYPEILPESCLIVISHFDIKVCLHLRPQTCDCSPYSHTPSSAFQFTTGEEFRFPEGTSKGLSWSLCLGATRIYKDPHLNPDSVPRRKRSKLRQSILSPAQRLQRTLDNNLQAPDFEIISDGDEPVTLIYARNKYIPPNEIGLGAMLLVSPTTTTERSMPLSATAEDTVSCSMDVS
uniref:GATA zinc finger containing protein-like protein n=1 Tax=Solanum tuberosum TaxID=4113 RepID=A0A0X8NHX9_SOLTU|nr:GATA zinc finger containing protein-like protein [Solanum tuberosum]